MIAIGIGASSTIFSWVRSVLLDPLPGAAKPQNVVALESVGPNGDWYATSYLDFRDLRENCKLIQSMSVAKPMALPVGNDQTVERVWGEVVSARISRLHAGTFVRYVGASNDVWPIERDRNPNAP
jgi:hypothetical protein